ncbi:MULTISPECIES: hypothetical protein [Porcipelethomonas]|uniref:hypothetical protein n=1 Tax=Porcipelethomonas TaxID=2981643 RepID=UPI000822AE68|nr:hypothetical protein [Porcipelethomonas ammoniilytica]MCU6720112.1 hypothetical protein [Porcipelethomonas ammoniilytica]SCJ01899.1 Uncharacterised protein [uncultured Ruminococcus sp.]
MNKSKPNMIYTPKLKIPLGEIILKQNGSHVLKIKKPNKSEYEEITIDSLMSLIYSSKNEDNTYRDSDF